MRHRHAGRSLATVLLALLLVVAAACGGGSSDQEEAPLAPDIADPSVSLPPNDNRGETPRVAGACAPGEPECVDTISIDGDQPVPMVGEDAPVPPGATEPVVGTGGGPASSGGMLVDGGLSVPDALATDATGIIAVRGFLIEDGSGARLCELLAESFPPQCGGASIPVSGYEAVVDVPFINAQDVTWTDVPLSLLGEIVDGTLVVDSTVTG